MSEPMPRLEPPELLESPVRFRCSICSALIAPTEEALFEHTAEERDAPTWPGAVSFSRSPFR
jgi:hypothetical protein